MDCRSAHPLLETFVDGELGPEQTLSIEAHLDACAGCAERCAFLEAMKLSTQRLARADSVVSDAFRRRLDAALIAEREREMARAASVATLGDRLRGLSWRGALPLAAAAAFLIWLKEPSLVQIFSTKAVPQASGTVSSGGVSTAGIRSADMSAGFDQALDRLIDYHSSPPPAQVTSLELLPTLDRDVGVRVHAPELAKFGASWEGASLVPVRNHQAAYLRYRMPGRHVTVYVYDARKVPVHHSLTRKMFHDRTVYVGEWRGYTVAAKENHGIGYAMASDLDDTKTAELLTEIH